MSGWIGEKPQSDIKIDIGSGDPRTAEVQFEGFLHQDIEPYEGINLVCDIRDLDKYIGEGECEIIRACHVIEHFEHKEITPLFKMFHRLLKKDGLFGVIVPNFLYHAGLAALGEETQAIIYAFGEQKDAYDFHKTAFTPKILRAKLQEAGFSIEEFTESASLGAVGKK